MKAKVAFLLSVWVFIVSPYLIGAQAQQKPLSAAEIEGLLKGGVPLPRVGDIVKKQGVDFKMTSEIRRRLSQSGADADLLALIIEVADKREPPPLSDPVTTLLSKARKQEAANRLTTPVGENALETYQQLLRLEPGQLEAAAGIRRIKERYIQWGKEAEERGEWQKALTNYQKAQEIDPNEQSVVAALKKVTERMAQPSKPPNLPPQIAQRFPAEDMLVLQQGDTRVFLAAATDPEGGELTYVWTVDGNRVVEGERFSFTGVKEGAYRISVGASDHDGLTVETSWSVQVKAGLAEPQLVRFTPQRRRISLLLHQSLFFGVQAEVPHSPESSLRYEWNVNGERIWGQEVFEFKEQSLGAYEVKVEVSDQSGVRLERQWDVEVVDVKENEEIEPLWTPHIAISPAEDQVVDTHQLSFSYTGKVQNVDTKREADNVVLWIILLDENGQPLTRRCAIPSPQPLSPGQIGTFAVTVPNLRSSGGFRVEVIRRNKEEEDYENVKKNLLRRAEAAKQKREWTEAEALYKIAMKVAPHEEQAIAAALQKVREVEKNVGRTELEPEKFQ